MSPAWNELPQRVVAAAPRAHMQSGPRRQDTTRASRAEFAVAGLCAIGSVVIDAVGAVGAGGG
jgi:anaerobic glycerol-3-phosphate dehydrogenase